MVKLSGWAGTVLHVDLTNETVDRVPTVDYEPEKSNSTYSKISRIEGVELRQEIINQEDAQIFFNENVVTGKLIIMLYKSLIIAPII